MEPGPRPDDVVVVRDFKVGVMDRELQGGADDGAWEPLFVLLDLRLSQLSQVHAGPGAPVAGMLLGLPPEQALQIADSIRFAAGVAAECVTGSGRGRASGT